MWTPQRHTTTYQQLQGPTLTEKRWLAKRAIDWSGMYLPTHVNKSSSCGRAVEAMFDSFTKNETWAAEMVDSWGKTSSGIFYGNSYYPGVIDQCLNVKSPDNAIHGKYCVINIRKASHKKTVHHINLPVTLEHLGLTPFIINDKVTNGTFFRYATCIPDVCSTEELWASLVQEYWEKDYNLLYTFCQPDEMFTAFTAGDIAFIAVVSILFSLMLAAGIVDVYIQNTNNKTLAKGGLKYLLPFSVYTNTQKLFELNTKSSPGTISCLHGIKVLSMTWVIFGHQQSASLQLNANTQDMWKRVNKFLYQAIANAYFSVDTFFMVGGLLLSCSAFRQLKRTGKFNVALFFLHRLVRLVPAIAIVAGLYATVVHFFMSGFFADFWHYWEATCSQIWWRDILFINNFVNEPAGLGLGGDCLGQCWYLAVDTQLYLVAPLIFLPLYYYAPVGKVWMYVLCVLSIYIPAQIIYTYDLPPSSFLVARNADVYYNKVYLTPWCRAGPWLVGIWLGYIMYTQDHKRVVLKKWQVVGGWTAAVCTGVLLVFGVWSYNTVPPKADYDIVTQVVYGGLQRFMWGVVMAWIIYACHYGAGGLVNDFSPPHLAAT
ncbi:nose resistant to fluoxetine protein 6-like isoform X2 [Homarus americanus]|uniref:nose resistant to fluoxetine protein 6-like isoform X2 n=1 Tax=Homarus americanus TaxID=6706 RepID=UPI001C4487E9|nr:nose resistant to fluoxetine protein 6-like isoform X2 [Homarus americanus]